MGRTTVRHVCSFRFSNRELWHSLDSSKMLSCYSVLFGINCFGYKYDSGACASCCWRWWWRWRVRAPFKRINSKRWTRNNAAREKKNASINSVQATRNRNCDSHITFFCCTIIHWCDNCYSSSFCVCVCTVQCSIWFEAARFAYFCSALSSSVCHFCVLAHFLLAERLNCFIAFVGFIPCADISRVFHAIEIYRGKTDILTCMRLIDCCRCCCHFAVAAIAAQRCYWDRALCELSCTGVCVCVR